MDFWYWDGIGYEDTRYEEAIDDYWDGVGYEDASCEEDEDDWDEPSDLEMGFDPYMGCYSDDC